MYEEEMEWGGNCCQICHDEDEAIHVDGPLMVSAVECSGVDIEDSSGEVDEISYVYVMKGWRDTLEWLLIFIFKGMFIHVMLSFLLLCH